MKTLVGVTRIFVGILFMISGFIKLNDPLGFSYKLQEYFSEQVLNMEFLIPFALVIAIILVIFELVLGIMLIIGYLPKFTMWSLLVMILFFTFLTFYSAYFNKVTDCGCFGDALPLTPWQSFYKDVVLLVLILFLFFNRKLLHPILAPASHRWIIFLSFMLCFLFAYHVLMHLPVIDFRAYKIGNNIREKMQLPANARKAEYEYTWKFKSGEEEVIIKNNGAFPQVEGKYIGVETKLVQEGDKPAIYDFLIEKQGENVTDEVLNAEKLLLIVAYSLRNTEEEGFEAIKKMSEEAVAKGYKVIALTSSGDEAAQNFINKHSLNFEFYRADETLLKTIVRANPGILTLEGGTITQKVHWFDAQDIKL
ncbi:DoxX family protein [Antarcticibacterium arcticum]|uniref:DoxX family protein n=1 Tax=Antarcticibacterium arcticum TaxID=2585771 RepID=A0A5B8YJC5_9FLAO|nr:BT_3928 family protein [Antarcticibacterium arcticum]QED37864.1 DoxX family protein [Antarcticibacterium arcticum]